MMKIKAREAFSLTERLKARMNLNFTLTFEKLNDKIILFIEEL